MRALSATSLSRPGCADWLDSRLGVRRSRAPLNGSMGALDPNDEIAKGNEVAAEPRGIVAGVGGVDLELLNGGELRANLRRQRDDGVVVGGNAAGTVERIYLELHLVQAGEGIL